MTGRVRHAEKSEEAGADVVAAQGTEAGALALIETPLGPPRRQAPQAG